jgi:hypothetical protein
MKDIYQVRICGRTFESRNLRQLLARAVLEKRSMDRMLRFLPAFDDVAFSGGEGVSFDRPVTDGAGQVF